MATAKPKKRKFKYSGMLIAETDSSSNDSTTHLGENQSPPKKKTKFVHSHRLIEDSRK